MRARYTILLPAAPDQPSEFPPPGPKKKQGRGRARLRRNERPPPAPRVALRAVAPADSRERCGSGARGAPLLPRSDRDVARTYAGLWRTPVLAGMRLPVMLRLPDGVRDLKDPGVDESRTRWSSGA